MGGYDFVNRNGNFYQGGSHGMSVLSDIACYVDGQFVGTAPDAQFYLFITEDVAKEVRLEESLWVEAAERADHGSDKPFVWLASHGQAGSRQETLVQAQQGTKERIHWSFCRAAAGILFWQDEAAL